MHSTLAYELLDRRKLAQAILEYPNWQFIIQFERHRDTISVPRYVFEPKRRTSSVRRRPLGIGSLATADPAQLPVRRSRRIGSTCVDAITTATRIERKFLPKLKRLQRGGVDLFWCVEDYGGHNAHASVFVGNVHVSRFTPEVFHQLASESGLTVGRNEKGYLVTRWADQWHSRNALGRYLTKSIDPGRFGDPGSVLNSSSGAWGYSDTLARHLGLVAAAEHATHVPKAAFELAS